MSDTNHKGTPMTPIEQLRRLQFASTDGLLGSICLSDCESQLSDILAAWEADRAALKEHQAWIETARESERAAFESHRNLSTYMTAPNEHNFNLMMAGLDVVSRDCFAAMKAKVDGQQTRIAKLEAGVRKLADIADAYDSNDLDDEARKFWGLNDEHENKTDPKHIEIYQGRGGRELLTLADCIDARTALEGGQQ
jgi:hypothetical protein